MLRRSHRTIALLIAGATCASAFVIGPLGDVAQAITYCTPAPCWIMYSTDGDHFAQFSAGLNPSAVVTDDLNSDGFSDLVVTNAGSSDVSVLLGDGSGSYPIHSEYATGTAPAAVALGDVNGDTFADLVTANAGSATVSVLLGDGTGGVGAKTDFATGSGPRSVAVTHLDGDTALDLAVANMSSGTVSVLLGDGSGGFGPKTDFSTGASPRAVAVGDMNGDMFTDLVTANAASATVSVLLGDGTGGFGAKTDFATGTEPRSVAVADLNGDTFLDLAVTNRISQTVSVLLGAGTGVFGPKHDFATGFSPRSVVITDLNGDLAPDLAVGYGSTQFADVSLLRNDGTAEFVAKIDFEASLFGAGEGAAVAVGQLNSDPFPDIAVANASKVAVLPATPQVPAAPTFVSAVVNNTEATVSWTPPVSDGGTPVIAYVVTPYVGFSAQPSVTFNSTATTQVLTGLQPGANYHFKIAARNAIGNSPMSLTAAVPGPPTILRNAHAGNGQATVSWIAPTSDGGASITAYVVTPYVGYFPRPPITVFNSTATTQTVTGLTNGTTYRFKVAAINRAGTGPTSTVTNPVTPIP